MNERLQKLEQTCKNHGVKALYVFGSRAAQASRALQEADYRFEASQRDLDIGVLVAFPFSIESKVELALELEDVFGAPRVDLSFLPEVDAFLAANIIRGKRVYTEDPYHADEYELFVLRRAGDLAELERERMAMILAGDR